eukprot:32085-Chlamydomonas_euryale.AAC.1
MGEDEWECSRVLAGRPSLAAGELGPGSRPLEAGLYHAVSLHKAIGYDGMRSVRAAEAAGHARELWGLELNAPAAPGDAVTIAGERVGRVTSATVSPTGRRFALAYVTAPAGGGALAAGLAAEVGGAPAMLAELPFATRRFLAGGSGGVLGPGAEVFARRQAEATARQVADAESEARARVERIAAAADKLAAWREQQMGGAA